MNDGQTIALATRFFDAIERGDLTTVRDCYAPDAAIWHNTDDAMQSVKENLALLAGFVARVPHRRYEERRHAAFDGGFVQRHVLAGTYDDGATVRLAACVVCEVAGGRIVRLDEYFDATQVAAFRRGRSG